MLSVHASLANGNNLANLWVGDVNLQFIRNHVGTPVFLHGERQLRRFSSIVAADGSRMRMPSAQLPDRRHNVAGTPRKTRRNGPQRHPADQL